MTEVRKRKKRRWVVKLRNKYRLVIMNDETYEEKFSLRLSPLNVFTWGGSLLLITISLVIGLVAFTSLREMIPGYADVGDRRRALDALERADSLEREMILKDRYLNNIALILEGKIAPDDLSLEDTIQQQSHIMLRKSVEDSLLRAEIESQDKYNITFKEGQPDRSISGYFFFAPISGMVTASFDQSESHYGTDIAAPENEAVKATLDGTVIMSSWTTDAGHVIQVQHANNMISVYKHNSVLLKKTGDFVKAGEAIAIVGNTGQHTTGPHLHFELWFNGNPINPQDYIQF